MPSLPRLRRRAFAVPALVTLGVATLSLSLLPLSCSRRQTVPAISSTPQLRIPAPAPMATPADPVISPVQWTPIEWAPEAASRDWKYIVIHHTATDTGSVESIHRTHLARKDANGNPWRGIGYHFVIGNGNGMPDGAVEATFRWNEQLEGAHAGDATFNQQGIGICLIGNFEKHPPTDSQLRSLESLTQTLADRYGILPDDIKGHGDVKSTACPGRLFPMQQLTQVLLDRDPAEPERDTVSPGGG